MALQGSVSNNQLLPWEMFIPTAGVNAGNAQAAPQFNGPLWDNSNSNNLTVSPSMTVAPQQVVKPVQDVRPQFTYNMPTYNVGGGGASAGVGIGKGGSSGSRPPTPQDYKGIWTNLAQQRYDEAAAAYRNGSGSAMAEQMALANLRQWQGYNDASVQQMQFYAGGLQGPLNYALSQGYGQGIDPSVVDWFNNSPNAGISTMMGTVAGGATGDVYGSILGPENQVWYNDYGNPINTGTAWDGSSPGNRTGTMTGGAQTYGGTGGYSGIQNYMPGPASGYSPAVANIIPSTGYDYSNPYTGVQPNGPAYSQLPNGTWFLPNQI